MEQPKALLSIDPTMLLPSRTSCTGTRPNRAIAAAVGRGQAEGCEPRVEDPLKPVVLAQIVRALKEAGHDLMAGGVSAMKKDEWDIAAVARASGERWLPALLRRSPD